MDTNGGMRIGRWLWVGVTCLPTAALPALFVAATPVPVRAEEPLGVSASYGAGVHAYFDGDYPGAYDALTAAIEAGSMDPRAYYYRGLASIKLGKSDDEINGDFSEGSTRETMGRGGLSVSRSLERVQGRDRMRLEKYRQRARVAAVQRDEAATRQRYVDIQDRAPDVLRRRVPDAAVVAPEPVGAPAAKPKVRTPSPVPGAKAPRATPEPRAKADAPADDPFADPTPRPGDDPFGDEPLRDDRLDQRDEQMEENAAELDDRFDQRDERMEESAAELDDRLDQIDAQQEREAAGGF